MEDLEDLVVDLVDQGCMADTAHLYMEKCAVVGHHRTFRDLVPCVQVEAVVLDYRTQPAGD